MPKPAASKWLGFLLGFVIVIALVIGALAWLRDSGPMGSIPGRPAGLNGPDYTGVTVDRVILLKETPGHGETVTLLSRVKGHWVGFVYDPVKAGNSAGPIGAHPGEPDRFELKMGDATFPKPWQDALVGMKSGGQRTLLIPPAKAYGERGNPSLHIPPNLIIQVEVTLDSVE